MKRRPEAQTKRVFVLRLSQVEVGQTSQLTWRSVVSFTERCIEPAYAAKPRCNCYLAHLQVCLINQLLSEMQPPGCGDRRGRCAQVTHEQSSQLTASDSQTSGESVNVFSFQGAFTDKTQSPRNCSRRSQPSRSSGRCFRSTTKTRPIARFGSRCGGWKVTYVLFPDCANRTDGPAIDSGALHTDKETAVKPGIARQPRLRTGTKVEIHFCIHMNDTQLTRNT